MSTTWTEEGHVPSAYSTDIITNSHLMDTDPHPQYLTPTEGDAAYVNVTGGDTITASAATVIPLTLQGAASQSANLFEARDSAGAVLASIDASGDFTLPFITAQAQVFVTSNAAGRNPLLVRGAASQTANLAEFQDSAGTVLARVSNDGSFVVEKGVLRVNNTTSSATPIRVKGAESQTANLAEFQDSAGTVLVEVRSNGAFKSPRIEPHSTVATSVPLFVKGAASQTSDLTQWHDSAGTVLMAVTAAGRTKFNALDGTAALGAYQGFINVTIGGTVRKIGIYA